MKQMPWMITLSWVGLLAVVHRAQDTVVLSRTERDLLAYLAAAPDRRATRDALLADVWGYGPKVRTRTLDVTVMRLRKKLADDGRDVLPTVRGFGYALAPPPAPAAVALPPTGLVGRATAVAEAREAIAAGRPLVLWGPVGVGRLTVARAALAEQPALWIAGPDLVAGTLEALGVPPSVADASPPASLVPDLLRSLGAQVLVVADAPADAAPTLAHWLRAAPDLRLVATAEGPLGLGHDLELDPLGRDDARTLLGDTPAEPEDVAALLDVAGGLPLALTTAADWLALLPAADVVRRFTDGAAWTALPGDLTDRVQAAWDRLPRPLQDALAVCAAFAAPVAPSTVEPGVSVGELGALRRRGWLSVPEQGDRLAMVEILRRFVAHRRPVDVAELRQRRLARLVEQLPDRGAGRALAREWPDLADAVADPGAQLPPDALLDLAQGLAQLRDWARLRDVLRRAASRTDEPRVARRLAVLDQVASHVVDGDLALEPLTALVDEARRQRWRDVEARAQLARSGRRVHRGEVEDALVDALAAVDLDEAADHGLLAGRICPSCSATRSRASPTCRW